MVEGVKKTNNLKTFTLLLISVFFHFCTLSPASAFTIGEERELGEKLLYSVRSAFSLIDEPDITQYITRLGQSVLEVAGIQYFDYRFYVIDNKEFNAFAAPSGLIFFNSGLIATMETEDELVSVLAHEVGHIVKRHIAARMEKSKYSSIGSVGMALAALAFGGAATPALLTGALATGQSFNLHFSRLHEEEADLLAYGWMKELHRDPEGQVKMLESMRRIARYRSEKPPQYLLTHPNPEERLNYIESLVYIDKDDFKETRKPDDNFEFLRFKYRILTKTKQSRDVKGFLASIIADSRSNEFKKVMAYYGLSQLAKNENDIDNGLAFLGKVITHFPEENILKVDKATLEFAGGQFEDAERTLRKVLVKDNSDMYATVTLAKLLYSTGRISESKEYFQTVSYELPEYPTVYFELGQIASDQKEGGVSSYYLGKYYLYQGKLKQAEQHFKNALRSDTLPEKMKAEIKKLFNQIKRLRE